MSRYEDFLREPVGLADHIRASLEIKKRTVEIDEFDQRQRNLFNYGHTFGHAIESVSDYRIPHGQAVTMGMDIANYLSRALGLLDEEKYLTMHGLLIKNLPDFTLVATGMDAYIGALARDKKNVDGGLTCILTSGPGHMSKVRLPLDQTLKNLLESYFQAQPVSGR
jgi:3-dehydroquinate synthase